MIFFAINSDYHFNLAENIVNYLNFEKDQFIFICHPGPRNRKVLTSSYKKFILNGHPLGSGNIKIRQTLTLKLAIDHKKEIKKKFKFKGNDILILLTEAELNNHYYAKMVKDAGGKVMLFDEGIGTYAVHSPFHKGQSIGIENLFKQRIGNAYFRLLGLPTYRKFCHEGFMFAIKEKYIDYMFSSHNLPIDRNINIVQYRHFNIYKNIELSAENVLFATSSLKIFGLEKEELEISFKILQSLTSLFQKVYLKIHPADYVGKTEAYNFFQAIVIKYPKIVLVDNNHTSNEIIEKYNIGMIISPFSTALIDALFLGCQPVFFYHLLPKINEFSIYDHLLKAKGYNFIDHISDINVRYTSNISRKDMTHKEGLEKYLPLFSVCL